MQASLEALAVSPLAARLPASPEACADWLPGSSAPQDSHWRPVAPAAGKATMGCWPAPGAPLPVRLERAVQTLPPAAVGCGPGPREPPRGHPAPAALAFPWKRE